MLTSLFYLRPSREINLNLFRFGFHASEAAVVAKRLAHGLGPYFQENVPAVIREVVLVEARVCRGFLKDAEQIFRQNFAVLIYLEAFGKHTLHFQKESCLFLVVKTESAHAPFPPSDGEPCWMLQAIGLQEARREAFRSHPTNDHLR